MTDTESLFEYRMKQDEETLWETVFGHAAQHIQRSAEG